MSDEEITETPQVVDRGRYGLLLTLVLIAFIFTGIAVMIQAEGRNARGRHSTAASTGDGTHLVVLT